jgi:predicted CxxxxCH...CXXCH cytochrome family protein
MKKTINYILGVLLIGAWAGCAELKKELPSPVAAGAQAHGPEWMDTASANFHGKVVAASSDEYQSCLTCHGWDFNGGISNVSCVTCHVAENATIHGRGWMNPVSPNFHGKAIRANNWDMRDCKSCHGETYAGGRVPSSCRDCHVGPAGPENCATCHGSSTSPAPPRDLGGNTSRTALGVGAHQRHLVGGLLSGAMGCGECHNVPGSVYAPGHIDTPHPAEVPMAGYLARVVTNEPHTVDYDSTLPLFTPNPTYNHATGGCANTYCHGNFKNGNPDYVPVWNDTSAAQAACGTCHGDVNRPGTLADKSLPKIAPEGTHPNNTNCAGCHAQVATGTGNALRISNTALHMNGKLNVFGQERDY